MGVTVHFEGKLSTSDAFDQIIENAKSFASEMEWEISEILEKSVSLKRVKDDEDWNYVGPVKGLEIFPCESCEPFRLEFDKNLYVQEFTKTQFAPIEVHVLLVDFLRKNSNLFEFIEITDEGEFLETNDVEVLKKHITSCNEQMQEYLASPDKYYGPVKLENGRIVDVMER